MSAIAQPVAAAAARPERRPSGWQNLKPLLPYVARYKGMVALGLILDVLMGIVAALPQLIQGIIADLSERAAATAYDAVGERAGHAGAVPAFLRTAEQPRAGALLLDDCDRDAGEGNLFVLDALDSDRSVARNRV